jgi:hypothetical protein
MKALLAAALIAGSSALAAPAAHAAPAPIPTSAAFHSGWGVGVGIGIGGGYGYGYAPARPYWGVTGYSLQTQTVFVGHDALGRPVYTTQRVSVPVYGWIYPAVRRAYRPYVYPTVSVGLGYRW